MMLSERADILTLREVGGGVQFSWVPQACTWCKSEPKTQGNIFSKIGISARTIVFTMYRRNITPKNALRWKGQFCFITDVVPDGIYLIVTAALVQPTRCIAERIASKTGDNNLVTEDEQPVVGFPGVLTEKYLNYSKDEPHNANEITFVLVTPKQVQLKSGDIVVTEECSYNVIACHTLDGYKNEYEIRRKKEV